MDARPVALVQGIVGTSFRLMMRDDIQRAIGSDYSLNREVPQAGGILAFGGTAVGGGNPVEIKAVDLAEGGPPLTEAASKARRVRHPNILPIIESGQSLNTFYWISPSIDARSLRVRLGRGGRMVLSDSLIVLRDVSAGLTHAHLHGVVHGGLTPDSILISGGSAIIADLGVSEVYTAIRHHKAVEPNPVGADPLRYSTPEQARGGQADARSDVYAWGMIAYELLSGRHPFAGRITPKQMAAAHLDEEPAQLMAGKSKIPPAVSRLVMRCLSKDPSKRPESAREILSVMTRAMLVPPPAPAAGSGQKVVVALAIVLLVLVAVIAFMGLGK
ncbi:MAG: serine/threonine-protein kinase [Gemmatimonadaceae bacterium]